MNMYAEKSASEKDKTGIPIGMKTRFERSGGFSFDDVRVHYNSEKPAQLHAHAYTQGNEVYVAPGQEKYLPHELGHVVQQKSNAVKPTGEIGGLPLNDDKAMEDGADKIAETAEKNADFGEAPVQAKFKGDGVVQRASWFESTESYNAFAGFGSLAASALGMIGGGIGYFVSKRNERKHRYIEEIEKYADAACDAQEEQIAAVEQFNEAEERAEKARARSEAIKLETRIERNYEAAVQKANAMGKIDNIFERSNAANANGANANGANANAANANGANANAANANGANANGANANGANANGANANGANANGANANGANANGANANGANANGANANAANANNENPNRIREIGYNEINAINDKNVRNALAKAKKAYEERVKKEKLVMNQEVQQNPPQQNQPQQNQPQQNQPRRRRRNRRRG